MDTLPKKETEEDELKKCEQEKKEYLEGWQRAKADLINYKNDEGKRFEDMARFVSSSFLQDILPILDSFDLAVKTLGEAHSDGEMKGMALIRLQLLDMLKKRGLVQIAVAHGEHFNPEKHESVGELDSDVPSGTIAEEIQRGYMLRDRVLRPARVRIAK